MLLLWLAAVACFPGGPVVTPGPPESIPPSPASQFSQATPATALQLRPTAALPPTLEAPTAASHQSQSPTGTPQPTFDRPAPAATPEPASTGAPAATVSGYDSALFEDVALLEDLAFGYLQELAAGIGPRTSGTILEGVAAAYLAQRLERLGYNPQLQEFSWSTPQAGLIIDEPTARAVTANILFGANPGQATAPLVFVGLARPEDIPAAGLHGKIALIERGEITFGRKVAQVREAGALAAVIFNNVPGRFSGTLGRPGRIPAVSISQADGRALQELIALEEPVTVSLSVLEQEIISHNVIAELPGTGAGVIVIGAHYDTVPDSVGASDNASGMGVLLAASERAAAQEFPFTLRFIAFGAEETGLHGSNHYVDSLSPAQLDEIYLMINLDSVGSGSGLRVSGERWVVNYVAERARQEGMALNVSSRAEGGSDHVHFRNAWVPIVYFRANDLSRINSPADTLEHINLNLLGNVTALTLYLLENVAELPGYAQ